MGTETNQRRNRATRRGFVSFVAFMLLFVFAFGQGSSLIAFANDTIDASRFSAASEEGTGSEAAVDDQAAPEEDAAPVADDGGAVVSTPTAESGSEDRDGGSAPRVASASRTSRSTSRLAAAPDPGLDGGDIDLDFVAAGPFTYDHDTGLGTAPQFGYDNRTISKTNGVVESLEGGDFECGDLVTFFTQVVVAGDAGTPGGSIDLDYSFGAETTGQKGIGFDDIVSVGVNTPDGGNQNLDGNESATLISETLDPPGDQQGYDVVLGTVRIGGLDAADTVIVRLTVHLGCQVGASPTGNILNSIEDADVVTPEADSISVGQQTVPMKKVEDVAQPGLDVNKTCPSAAAVGEEITYTIDIINTGNEALEIVSVLDTVNGHAADDISDLFPASVGAGATVSADYDYTVLQSDPDPLPNSVAVEVEGAVSGATLSGNASCETDVTHEPAIDVTKTCPQAVPAGEAIEYTITVENTGNEPLVGVSVNDTLLGDITDEFDADFTDPLPVGALATATVSYTPQAGDPDPLTNTVTASGDGADSGATATDEASCETDVRQPAIQIVKEGPALVHRGDTITYGFEVTNLGETELFDVELSDPVCDPGTIVAGADVDASLAVGEVWHFTCTHLVTEEDPDPIPNTATVRGDTQEGEGGQEVTDSDDHVVDIIAPAIDIVKTVSEETVPVGTTVTYTYVVTNTGDTTLYDISVDDDVIGHIGDVATLDPGKSVTLTAEFVVGEEVVVNVATVDGSDILGRSVSADDDAIVTPIAGQNPPPPTTPFTGSEAGRLGLLSIALLGIGVTVVAATRRRRPQTRAA